MDNNEIDNNGVNNETDKGEREPLQDQSQTRHEPPSYLHGLDLVLGGAGGGQRGTMCPRVEDQ